MVFFLSLGLLLQLISPFNPQESLDDVGTELRDMRDELHKLMGVIESKDHAIETLENQLRSSKEEIKMKYAFHSVS